MQVAAWWCRRQPSAAILSPPSIALLSPPSALLPAYRPQDYFRDLGASAGPQASVQEARSRPWKILGLALPLRPQKSYDISCLV